MMKNVCSQPLSRWWPPGVTSGPTFCQLQTAQICLFTFRTMFSTVQIPCKTQEISGFLFFLMQCDASQRSQSVALVFRIILAQAS